MSDKLSEYRKKRDFRKTPEPEGGKSKGKHIFVIQKHDASRLHYDFRIEVGGVLKSWAVPKGPSTDPSVKRLAAMTEDHPAAYADFEGIISEGYGEGTVIIWDQGSYENIKKDDDGNEIPMEECLENGKVEIKLHGKKLKGGYALIKMKGKKKDWLLIKMKDEHADARRNPVSTEPDSVKSGKSIEELNKEKKKQEEESGD